MTGFGEQRPDRAAETAGTDHADLQRAALREAAVRVCGEGARCSAGCEREQSATRKNNSLRFAHVCFPSG
jgi:hypothetical protein